VSASAGLRPPMLYVGHRSISGSVGGRPMARPVLLVLRTLNSSRVLGATMCEETRGSDHRERRGRRPLIQGTQYVRRAGPFTSRGAVAEPVSGGHAKLAESAAVSVVYDEAGIVSRYASIIPPRPLNVKLCCLPRGQARWL